MPKRPLAVLLVGATLSLTVRADLAAASNPPLCRVTATYRPLWWASNLRQIAVRLDPACPSDGLARVRLGNYGGPGSRATGPTETLTRSRPVLLWAAQPSYRTVLWVSASGRTYPVPLTREVTHGVVPMEGE